MTTDTKPAPAPGPHPPPVTDLSQRAARLARMIERDCFQQEGHYIIELDVSPHPNGPMGVQISKADTLRKTELAKRDTTGV